MRGFVTGVILFASVPLAFFTVWLAVTGQRSWFTFGLLTVGCAIWAVSRERKDRLRVLSMAQKRRKYWEG